MAVTVVQTQLDMQTLSFVSGNVTTATPTLVVVTHGADSNRFVGTGMAVSPSGHLSGTMTGYSVLHSGVTQYSVSGLNMDLAWMQLQLATGNGLLVYQTAYSGNDNITGAGLADWLYGFTGNDSVDGGGGNDTIFGVEGNDVLTGGAGNDLINGGVGTDRAVFSGPAAAVVDLALVGTQVTGYGTDELISIENLSSGNGNDRLSGNSVANSFSSGAGNDSLMGRAGNDTLNAGAGNDTLDGGTGSDSLIGGAGNDRYIIDDAQDIIVEAAGGGTADRVLASVTFILAADDNIEILETSQATSTGAINLTGNALTQRITGNAGNNQLSDGGGAGEDTLLGLAGNDTFVVRNAGTLIVESAGGGIADRVLAGVSFVLAADDNIEALATVSAAATTAINLTGNALAQKITGNAGINQLSDGGGAGADTLTGLAGNDTYIVRNAATQIVETAGNGTADRVMASVSFSLAADDNIELLSTTSAAGTTNLGLTGNGLAQTITGNAGANRLNGLGGLDHLTGGLGTDTFVFSTALGPTNIDDITDFNVTADTIELENSLFGNLAVGALQSIRFVANTSGLAETTDQRIIYDTNSGILYFDADGSGNASTRIQFATIDTSLAMTEADFNLV